MPAGGRAGAGVLSFLTTYLDKRTAPYAIWTAVALVCALYFWLSRDRSRKSDDASEAGSSGSSSSADARGRGGGRSKRKVCLALDGTLLKAAGGSGAGAVEVIDAAVAPFLELCASCEVFAVALATEDARESAVTETLEALGAFDAGFRRHRLMFSSTVEGRASMVRHLQPSLHLEADDSVRASLEGKVPELRLVSSEPWRDLRAAIGQGA
eukprot:TRINITY_DN25044_c0_g1_i1.p1 TRINITY_DN25044_c0_g1~~TRINITY_DN25044_c0_g1_i1.p1  ORF type:complete len:237 (+),score=40.39 TRINITY_DN25044_c0_g1_i1:79-711(+)